MSPPLAESLPGSNPVRRRAIQIGKVLIYFAMLILGVRLFGAILKEISVTQYAHEFNRVRAMAASILDVNKNLDDLVVTFFALSITFLLILPISWVHMITKGDESDPSLTQTLIVLSVIVAGVMMMLEDNLARAFSLVGVVAAVRYRNTLKDPKDAVYVFLSLGIGMACGFQSYHVALVLSLFECAILLVLWIYRSGTASPSEPNLLQPHRASEENADLETRRRYLAIASNFPNKKGKTPNAVITVKTTGAASAQTCIDAQLAEHPGNWRLLGTEENDGLTTLEYLGRLPRKGTPPLIFLEQLRTADPAVRGVVFRSLRKAGPDPVSLNGHSNGRAPVKSESPSEEGKG